MVEADKLDSSSDSNTNEMAVSSNTNVLALSHNSNDMIMSYNSYEVSKDQTQIVELTRDGNDDELN